MAGRPASADGERPSTFERLCKKNRPPSAPPLRGPPAIVRFPRPCYPEPEKSRKVYDYGVNLEKRRAASAQLKAAMKLANPKQASPQKTSPPRSSSPFKRWGSPFPQTCRKSGYPCSPNLTILKHVSAGSEYAPARKRSPVWQNSTADMQSKAV
jgi:hypothetical protein